MGRKRKNKASAWMPPRVYMGKSAYEYHPKDGGNIRLCDRTCSQSEVWAAWEKLLKETPKSNILESLIKKFFNSPDFYDLAKETQKDYLKYSKPVIAVFGQLDPDNVKPEHIRKYMDKRGLKSKVQANREKAFISRVYRWGYERGMVKSNPSKGVKQFKEKGRDRYITDVEYNFLYSVSCPVVRIAMELAYLCCARQSDILELKKNQIMDDGILIKQSKTGVTQIKIWSDRLREAIKQANNLDINSGITTIYLIHQPTGGKYTRDGFNSRWRKAKEKAKKTFPEIDFDFTFHDLKAKGVSDLDGNLYEKQAITGHKNVGQTAKYDRKIATVPVVGGQ
jgi:integrase